MIVLNAFSCQKAVIKRGLIKYVFIKYEFIKRIN